jgi:hypothetical protein
MKQKFYSCKQILALVFMPALLFHSSGLRAQFAVCTDPTTLFGLANSGEIFPISSVNANVGSQINITASYTVKTSYLPTATTSQAISPSGANGIGYSNVNGKIYYLKISPSKSTKQFISYDPVTNKYVILATPPITTNVYSGCVNFNGTGYYCISDKAELYYYNIGANTWTFITSTITDQFGADISAYVQSHASGDMASDGLGNLWFMPSSSSQFGLFELMAPLPTTSVASITVKTVVPGTTATPSNTSLWGVAFDPAGNIYMSTGDDKLYMLSSPTAAPVLVGSFNGPITGIGADLTSCAYPLTVLPVTWTGFTATLQNNSHVLLNWSISWESNNKGFAVEHSFDGANWQQIGYVPGNTQGNSSYSFTDPNPGNSYNYYRIRQVNNDGSGTYSAIRVINLKNTGRITFWPNPVTDVLNIQIGNAGGTNSAYAMVFDLSGKVILKSTLQPGLNQLSLKGLPASTYLVQVRMPNGELLNQKIIKQ